MASASRMRHIPNILSIFRILVCPLVIYFYHIGNVPYMWVGLVLFFLGSLSDMLDGQIARAYEVESHIGRIIDPIADKLLVISALFALYAKGMTALWVVIAFMLRDMLVTGMRLAKPDSKSIISPTVWAKAKTLYQMVAISFLLFWPIYFDIPQVSFVSIPQLILYPALLMSWMTAIPYFRAFFASGR